MSTTTICLLASICCQLIALGFQIRAAVLLQRAARLMQKAQSLKCGTQLSATIKEADYRRQRTN